MRALLSVSLGLMVVIGGPAAASGQEVKEEGRKIVALLNGYEEIPTLSTAGHGSFKARIVNNEIHYELRYANLESNIVQSHIHFGKPWVNGGIAAWLCGTAAAPGPAGNLPPPCVEGTEGTVNGVITAAQVLTVGTQGITAGEFQELIDAIRSGSTYVNVHSVNRQGGEIRGIVQ
jgi:hypothetical protein